MAAHFAVPKLRSASYVPKLLSPHSKKLLRFVML